MMAAIAKRPSIQGQKPLMSHLEAWRTTCEATARVLIEQHQWQLFTVEQLVNGVLPHLADLPTPTTADIHKLTINTYCSQALYQACLGQRGFSAQQRAHLELYRYLYTVALKRWPSSTAATLAEEATQIVHEKIAACRSPGAFLAFAAQKMADTAKKEHRRSQREQSLDDLLERNPHGDLAVTPPSPTSATETAVIEAELRRQVAAQLEHLQQTERRAARQLAAVRLRYLDELSIEEIAEQLAVQPTNVYVLLSRGLERLRQDETLRTLAQTLITDDG
jgi:RNA polymerase sigma factor (sigma-70 family)